jgi:NADPH-dependent 2,4-dienoyl-CoA reductase/sulfur reductase-like enzyme/rhodanese-related sulfurtransferase
MSKQKRTIVIVGGVAGGASAATRARRANESAEIILLEKDRDVSFANCGLPYYLGGEINDRDKLVVASEDFLRHRFRLDVRSQHEVLGIDRQNKTLLIRDLRQRTDYHQPYDKLILSTGAAPLVPPLEGVNAQGVFTLRNLQDTDRIKQALEADAPGKAVVVGAGFIGLEMVEQLIRAGWDVTLAELQPQVLPPMDAEMAQPLEEELDRQGVRIHLADGIQRIETNSSGAATAVVLTSGTTLPASLVILGLGVRPLTQLATDADIELGPTHGIATNSYLQTNDPDIYAVGDASEYQFGPTGRGQRVALAGPANRAGRLAGQHAATDESAPMAAVFGTAIVRVFDQTAATTGLSMKLARQLEVSARSVTVAVKHHAGYYPGASLLTLKLIYSPESGKVLGAQCVGRDGVDKRIDVIATAMSLGATARDLAGLDLAYAPPFGSAKDPVHVAAFVACNQLDGLVDPIDADADLTQLLVLDVRDKDEFEANPLAAAPNVTFIPLDELRERIDELDKEVETVVSCGVGARSHVAAQILRHNGFRKVRVLSGGALVRNRAVRDDRQKELVS